MQVEPQNTIPLIYQITDPSDSTVYYIRAVVYDSLTRDVISTQNLVSRGNGLWSSTVLAPVDSTGLGRHIHVIIRVYTDSGYTTLSDNYNQQIDKYLVKSSNRFGGGGGSGGTEVDYDKIKKMIETVISKKDKDDEEENKQLSEILDTVEASKKALFEIKQKDRPQDVSNTTVIKALKALETSLVQKIDGIEVPPPIDYSGSFKELTTKLDNATTESKNLVETVASTTSAITAAEKTIRDMSSSFFKNMEEKGNKLKEVVSAFISDGGAPPPAKTKVEVEKNNEKDKEISKYFNV